MLLNWIGSRTSGGPRLAAAAPAPRAPSRVAGDDDREIGVTMDFEFNYRQRSFRVERRTFLPYRGARPDERVPLWDLRRLDRGVVVLSAEPEETPEMVEARFTAWLEERYRPFGWRGDEYELYRIPVGFWVPQRTQAAAGGSWEIRRGGETIARFADGPVASASSAIARFIREQAAETLECFGGPLDGDRLRVRGVELEATGRRGYRRGEKGCHWVEE
jgi:hypothetical protein